MNMFEKHLVCLKSALLITVYDEFRVCDLQVMSALLQKLGTFFNCRFMFNGS